MQNVITVEIERWKGHRREHELMAQALVDARENVSHRLDGMNELRDQINNERSAFVTRDNFETRYESLVARVGDLEQARSNMEGRIWAIGAIGGAIIVVLEVALRFLRAT